MVRKAGHVNKPIFYSVLAFNSACGHERWQVRARLLERQIFSYYAQTGIISEGGARCRASRPFGVPNIVLLAWAPNADTCLRRPARNPHFN
jgi:hypothetical protein